MFGCLALWVYLAMCHTHAMLAAGVYGRRPAKFGELLAQRRRRQDIRKHWFTQPTYYDHDRTLSENANGVPLDGKPTTQPTQFTMPCESWLILWGTKLLTWQALRRVWDVLLVDGIEAIRSPGPRATESVGGNLEVQRSITGICGNSHNP